MLPVHLASSACAEDFTGPAVGVIGGHSIRVMHEGRVEELRRNGIACPEKGQAYGTRAMQAASELVYGKDETLMTLGLDKYGRTIGDVTLPDGTNINHTLVKDGWCWGIGNMRQEIRCWKC